MSKWIDCLPYLIGAIAFIFMTMPNESTRLYKKRIKQIREKNKTKDKE